MPRERSYKGQLALITGGASGLGLSLANRLAALGANPVLIDIAPADVPYRLEYADVSDSTALADAITRITDDFGPIDLAIANAGIDLTGEAHTFKVEDWQSIIRTNLFGATNLLTAVYPAMVARGSGQIILVSSGAGLIGFPLGAPYTASKAGLIGMGKALRAEAARYGIQVSVACPPILTTPLLRTGQAKPGINRQALIASLQKTPLSSERAAHHILKHTANNKGLIVFPHLLNMVQKLSVLFPPLGEIIRADILNKFYENGRS